MIIFLRDKESRNYLDLEVFESTENGSKSIDLHCSIPIETYSQLLLNNLNKRDYIIKNFSQLDEIRGWYWEYWKDKNPNHKINDLIKVIQKDFLEPICKELNLYIVTD